MLFKAFSVIIAFPSTTILLTNSCSSLRILGLLNGFATTCSGIGRALGPATTGFAFTWGADHGYMVTAYFFLALIAFIGAIPAFMIVEGDGPSASSEASDEEDSEAMEDSALLTESDDSGDEGSTLLGASEHSQRQAGYSTIDRN